MNTDEQILMQRIKNFAIQECKETFGYVGLTEGEDFIMINSGNHNLTIKIELKDN